MRERRVAGVLFALTCASVFVVYLVRWRAAATADAAWFTAALMTILIAHEAGHWLVARAHGVRLALPWFLPAPLLVGTLGAVIRWSDVPRRRSGLLEMSAAGPIAGLLATTAVSVAWLWGEARPVVPGDVVLSRPLLWWPLAWVFDGGAPPVPSSGDPLAFAAWIGCLVTAINLVPIGQLDGGHVVLALWPERARAIGWAATAALLVGGLFWPGWAIWAAVVHLLGTRGAASARGEAPSGRARWAAVAVLVAFVACFTPVPTG